MKYDNMLKYAKHIHTTQPIIYFTVLNSWFYWKQIPFF